MSRFDQAARYACKRQPGVVARRLLRRVRQRFEYSDFHESKTNPLPGQSERIADLVLLMANLDVPALPALMILEFQSRPDEDKLDSTLIGVGHLNAENRHGPDRKGRYQIFVGMVNLTAEPEQREIRFDLTDIDDEGLVVAYTGHKVLFWNVWQDDATEALREIKADLVNTWSLLFWVALMRGGATQKNRAAWLALVKRLSKRDQGDIGVVTRVFAELAGTLREWNETLKEVDMEDSQVVLEWTAQAEERGFIRARREDLLRLARKKFKKELKDEDVQMINAQDSADVLRDWFDAALDKDKYAEFRKVLRR